MSDELQKAKNLLEEALDIMSNVHLDDMDIFKEISNYLYGEEL